MVNLFLWWFVMKKNRDINAMAALRVSIYDCMDMAPKYYLQPVKPENALRILWIPQPIVNQIWVIYEFASKHDRMEWEKALPHTVSRWLDRRLLAHAQ